MATLSPNIKTVLITGCSEGGIGASLAINFQKTSRYHVFATARTISKIPAELSGDEKHVTVLDLDVTSTHSIERAAKAVSKKTGGRLDVLINNSGAAMIGQPAADTTLETAKAMFDVNYFGVMAVTNTFLPLLVVAKGTIVNNSSVAAEKWIMYNANYAATKAALNMYSECLRLEVAALGVRVLILATGTVVTKVLQNQTPIHIPEKSFFAPIADWLTKVPEEVADPKAMPADEYAQQVVQTIESNKSGKVFIGSMTSIFKNVTWWLPNWVWDKLNFGRFKGHDADKLATAAEKWRIVNSS